jgi:diaminopimelate decarboxylase
MIISDIVGPICESGDFMARGREIAKVNRGEYLAVMSAGAYGMSMSSNYNSRPFIAEVLVNGTTHSLIRKRGNYEDLVRNEAIPGYLR